MKKLIVGIFIGAIAGVIDLAPMLLQKLSWDADLSAFIMWLVVGFLVSVIDLKINPIQKGLLVSFAVLLPSAVLIGAKEPFSLIPIGIMTLVLGSLVGFMVEKYCK
jgi:hypothetical protein